jgi:hypothetical protein
LLYFVRECLRRARFHRCDGSTEAKSPPAEHGEASMAVSAVKALMRQGGFIAARLVLGCNSILRLHRQALAARRRFACIAFCLQGIGHLACRMHIALVHSTITQTL